MRHCRGMTSRQRWTLVATIIGSGVVFLDGTIVNVALKTIGQQLPATAMSPFEGQTYVVSGYLAVLAALLILSGALSDHYGRRRMYAIGLTGFAATSVLCGLAPTLEWLVVFRLFQGATGALLIPGSLSLITHAFDGRDLARAFGIWASATSALTLLGPIVGGTMVDTVGWRFAFLVNVPFIAAALFATLRHVAESRDTEATGRFDWLGAFVAALAIGGLSFGLIRGEQQQWSDPVAWVAIGIGLISLILFPILMTRRSHPLVPLGLFRSRAFATINLATFFVYGALYGNLIFQGLLLQGVLGYTALAAGAIGVPAGILLTLLSARVGTIAGRRGPRGFLLAGPMLMALGTLWWARIPLDSTAWRAAVAVPSTLIPPSSLFIDVLPAVLLNGLGISLVVAPLTSTLMGSIPGRFSGLGSAINNSISRVGQPLLGALIFIAMSAVFYTVLGTGAPALDTDSQAVRTTYSPLNPPPMGATPAEAAAANAASLAAFHVAMIITASLLITGALVSWFGLRDRRMVPSGIATPTTEAG
jgi:EmrB/QacA subfamily drug resistance transporter